MLNHDGKLSNIILEHMLFSDGKCVVRNKTIQESVVCIFYYTFETVHL